MAGREIKIFRQEQNLLVLKGATCDSLKIDGTMQDRKLQVKDFLRRTATLTRPDRDKHYIKCCGLAGMIYKTWLRNTALENLMLEPVIRQFT